MSDNTPKDENLDAVESTDPEVVAHSDDQEEGPMEEDWCVVNNSSQL